jgi:hypothetical protein
MYDKNVLAIDCKTSIVRIQETLITGRILWKRKKIAFIAVPLHYSFHANEIAKTAYQIDNTIDRIDLIQFQDRLQYRLYWLLHIGFHTQINCNWNKAQHEQTPFFQAYFFRTELHGRTLGIDALHCQ